MLFSAHPITIVFLGTQNVYVKTRNIKKGNKTSKRRQSNNFNVVDNIFLYLVGVYHIKNYLNIEHIFQVWTKDNNYNL